ncbi:hypothetical protein J31TS6_61700 [Brevibacillus reuszeri]|nr:hypothetical protein J31TS6_61700 [Brevibacillus reuszeri]
MKLTLSVQLQKSWDAPEARSIEKSESSGLVNSVKPMLRTLKKGVFHMEDSSSRCYLIDKAKNRPLLVDKGLLS